MKYAKDLAGLMASLNDLSTAAHEDDMDEYISALAEAGMHDATEGSIKDAHVWGSKLRLSDGFPATSFDWKGEPR